MKNLITKRFGPYPAAHRQHLHEGHCRFIHGHNWSFDITIGAQILDKNKFVVDFGKFADLRSQLADLFDHTLLVNSDDPEREFLKSLQVLGLAQVIFVDSGGAEGIAQLVYQVARQWLTFNYDQEGRGLSVQSVTVFEDDKNSATYIPEG